MGHRSAFYYDNKRNLTCVLDPDNGFTYFEYDAINRQTSVKSPWGEVTYYEYTPGGEVSKRILGNDCLTYYEHDGVGRTSKVDNRKSDLTLISSYEYQRNKVGSPVSVLRNDGWAVYYEYDRKHQLTKETQRDDEGTDIYAYEWTYDLAGNRMQQVFNGVTTDYSYNASNELTHEITEAVPTYYHYDKCGNQAAKQEGAGTTYYQYDYENLMTQIDFPDGSHNYFQYDADGKRTSKADSEGYTQFIYQGPNMLALMQERDSSENTVVQYTSGVGLENMRRDTGSGMASGDSSFFHYDALGSTQELTDSNEDVTDTYRYNAWGQILTRTGTTTNPHTYVGKERYYLTPDPVLYLLGLRYYDMQLGRFVTLDPIGMTDLRLVDPAVEDVELPNLMLYASNNPTALVDPTGLACCPDRLEVFHSRWDVDINQAIGRCRVRYVIKFRAFLKPQGNPQDCAIVQLIQGFTRDAFGFVWIPNYRAQPRVELRFPQYVVDTVDVDPRWASHWGPHGVVWSGHPAKAWWQDIVTDVAQRANLPYKLHHRFNTGIYDNADVPADYRAFEAQPPDPLKKKTWKINYKIYMGEGGQIEIDKNP